ncbi:acyl-CoA dehydratase activase-related protein, partial [Chlamydiota bacterium]
HARGSIHYVKDYIDRLKKDGFENINDLFCLLVDIGGEDTKISVISLHKNELFDNAMNIKCSAGTGSLMDTLQAFFGINSIENVCNRAFSAKKAYEINASCAVFLIENARKMQAQGYSEDEILASCNYAIIENMARSLWPQLEFPKNAITLLHGQTMLSDPLPLAVTHRIQEYVGEPMYCLVPPYPGHRACFGLIETIKGKNKFINRVSLLDDLITLTFSKKVINCRGIACGDTQACCTRSLLTTENMERKKLSLQLGGCTAVNELSAKKKIEKKTDIRDTYKEIWTFIDSFLPKSQDKNRLIIPRSFSISEYAYFFSQVFEQMGIPVYIDNVCEKDILEAQPLFSTDICAPLIGATGQFIRLSKEHHGIIFVPQIELLPTDGMSIGRTCTTNQGGVVIAKNFAFNRNPQANIFLKEIDLSRTDSDNLSRELLHKLQPIFSYYGISVDEKSSNEIIHSALREQAIIKKRVTEKIASILEEAILKQLPISIVCGREYVLNPGIYDSHIGKLLRDKNVIAIPSYAIETELDTAYSFMYWKNPHDILTKIDAISKKKFHLIIKDEKIKELVKQIETGLVKTTFSLVQVSTFRCGPDSVVLPTINEITRNIPHLFIQSDATIKELAHLENRVRTHLNQLNKKLHDELSTGLQPVFSIDYIDEFSFDTLNKKTDIVYFPTLNDIRIPLAIVRASGITAISNYEKDTYDLEKKVRMGRRFAGDYVCLPLAAVYADALLAVDDFIEKKKNNDPLVHDRTRILVFNVKGDGPCRQGQYYEMHKLLAYKTFGSSKAATRDHKLENISLKFLIAHEENNYDFGGGDEWALIQGFHAFFAKAVLHSLFLKGGKVCKNKEEFDLFYSDYEQLVDQIERMFEFELEPSRKILRSIHFISQVIPPLAGVAKYFGYGLYNNNGLRKIFKKFKNKWDKPLEGAPPQLKIHIDGEAYFRVAQIDEILEVIIDSIGFMASEVSYSPLWCYFEYLLQIKVVTTQEEVATVKQLLQLEQNKKKKSKLRELIKKKKRFIKENKTMIRNFRTVLGKPLYKAAGIAIPHPMEKILDQSRKLLPTLRPFGELAPYIGETLVQLQEGTDLIINAAPEGCMVSSMGEIFTPHILSHCTDRKKTQRIAHLSSLNGEIDEEVLQTVLLKTLGPEKYYSKN